MQILGKPLYEGAVRFDNGRARVDAVVEKIPWGYSLRGTVRGRPGRLEIVRIPAADDFLVNNWQSWGPFQKMRRGERLQGLEERMASYSRYVFTPIPDIFLKHTVSDYFVAWQDAVVGFLSSKVAHPHFCLEGDEWVGHLEYFDTALGEAVPVEPLVILQGHPVEELLEEYADLAAARNKAPLAEWNPVGWSSWYQYFAGISQADVIKNLRSARHGFPFEVFQIDDGYEKDIGDWLEVKEGFGSLHELAGLVRDSGLKPGLWTAPFSVSETSGLFGRKEWLVKDPHGHPKLCYRNWGKPIYALDTSHPQVKDWLYETFSSLRKMGYSYFKVDFLFAAAMEGGRTSALTPIQAYREGLRIIRKAVGDSFILGCGAPLLPSIGIMDGMRIGEDTAPFWKPEMSPVQGPNAYWALKNSLMRSFMHKRWWLDDPDCLLLRDKDSELTPNERELYALAAGAMDNMIIESDDLELVGEQGKRLLETAIGFRGGSVRVRGLMADDAFLIESKAGPKGDLALACNLGDAPQDVLGTVIPGRSAIMRE